MTTMNLVRSLFAMKVSLLFLLMTLAPISFAASAWTSQNIEEGLAERLYDDIVSIIKASHPNPNSEFGISAVNLKTGQLFAINGDKNFFMASTYKVAIATQLLTLVDENKLQLDKITIITPHDIVPGSGIISQYFSNGNISMPMLELLKLMMQQSDNTATDILLNLAGGPSAVTHRLRELHINQMRVDRSTIEFTRDYFGIQSLPSIPQRNYAKLMEMLSHVPENVAKKAEQAFSNDPRDNTTPNAMVNLLKTLYEGKALKPKTTELLLNIMSKKDENVGRLFFYLPQDTWIAEKLGTATSIMNDVGIIKLPHDSGTIIIAIYMKNIPKDDFIQQKVSARITKTIYDFFLLNQSNFDTRGMNPRVSTHGKNRDSPLGKTRRVENPAASRRVLCINKI